MSSDIVDLGWARIDANEKLSRLIVRVCSLAGEGAFLRHIEDLVSEKAYAHFFQGAMPEYAVKRRMEISESMETLIRQGHSTAEACFEIYRLRLLNDDLPQGWEPAP